jgi:hypothetical protein
MLKCCEKYEKGEMGFVGTHEPRCILASQQVSTPACLGASSVLSLSSPSCEISGCLIFQNKQGKKRQTEEKEGCVHVCVCVCVSV